MGRIWTNWEDGEEPSMEKRFGNWLDATAKEKGRLKDESEILNVGN